MVGKGRRLQGAMAAIGLLILIFDSRLALEGVRTGIELCLKTVIPALFPFFVLSMILTDSLYASTSYPVSRITKFLGIPQTAAPVLIPAVLGGYPVGAKCVGDLYHRNQISKREAQRLLAFCSNAGPSFLFGMVSGFFPERKMIWMLWFIHVFSAFLTAMAIPTESINRYEPLDQKEAPKKSIIISAAAAMCTVCCWVILFRTMITFLKDWFLFALPVWAQVLLMGILELTNGCCELMLIMDVRLRFILCACMLAFGGVCVLLQTASVTEGLSLKYYVTGKLMQTAFSFLASCAIVAEQGFCFAVFIPVLVLLLRKIQNGDSFPRILPV